MARIDVCARARGPGQGALRQVPLADLALVKRPAVGPVQRLQALLRVFQCCILHDAGLHLRLADDVSRMPCAMP